MIGNSYGFSRSAQYIEKYIEALQKYKYFAGGVIFVDYYSFDLTKSSISNLNQGGTYQLIGDNSPIRYTKIINYPLFFKSNYQLTTAGQQYGLGTETQIESLFISFNEPFSFVPTTYDLVVIRYGNEDPNLLQLLPVFRVANIQTLPIYTTNNLFKLNLVPSNNLYRDLLRYEQVQVTSVAVFDDKSTSFYDVSKYITLQYVREIKNKLLRKLENEQRDYKYRVITVPGV